MCTNLGVSDKDNDKIFFLSRCVPGRRCLEQKADDCFCSTTVSSVSPSQEDLVKVRQGGYFNISKKLFGTLTICLLTSFKTGDVKENQ